MENTERLTPQEHNELVELQQTESDFLYKLGLVEYQITEMQSQLDELRNRKTELYNNIVDSSKKASDFMLKIRNKYGEVKLNTATGEIIKEK